MTIRLSANLGFLWPDRELIERIGAASRAGFKAVELHWPYDTPASEVKAACAAAGVQLLGINTALGDAARGEAGLGALPGREADFEATAFQALDYATAAGGTSVHAMAGKPGDAAFEAARETFVANLKSMTVEAARRGLTVLLEPLNPHDMPGYFYSRVEEAADIQDRVGADNLKIMFDVYHVGRTQGDVLTRLEAHIDRIGHVQIAGVPARQEPDRGEIAYRAVFEALERLGYDGWVGAEYKPEGDTDEGLAWRRTLGVAP